MAKRYGRNQRRRAREQITALATRVASLEGALTLNRGLLRRVSDDNSTLRRVLAEARHVLGDSVALPPETNGLRLGKDQRVFLATHPANFPALLRDTERMGAIPAADRMHALLVQVELGERRLPGPHCRVQLHTGEFVYSIAESELYALSPEMLHHRLAPRIASQLTEAMVRHFATGR